MSVDPADAATFFLKITGDHYRVFRAHNSKWGVDFTIPAYSYSGLFDRYKTTLLDPGVPPDTPAEDLDEALDNEIRTWILNELHEYLKR